MSKKESKYVKRADKITAKLEAQAEGVIMANEEALRKGAELTGRSYEEVRESFKIVTIANLRKTREAHIKAVCVSTASLTLLFGTICGLGIKGKRIMKEREAQNQ